MPAPRASHKKKQQRDEPRPKFAPAAFISGSPAQVQALVDDLAELAAERFGDLTGTTWEEVGRSLAGQLRALGHDLIGFEETAELQEWQATWHHPRGMFVFSLTFRAPCSALVSWRTDEATYAASR